MGFQSAIPDVGTPQRPSIYRLKKPKIHLRLDHVYIGRGTKKVRRIPHSPNALKTMHWAEQARWKKAWETAVWQAWLTVRENFKNYFKLMPFEFADVEIYIYTNRPMDYDNAWASVKGIVDGLVKSNILRDDSYKHCSVGLEYVHVEKREAEHVELIIKVKKYAKQTEKK